MKLKTDFLATFCCLTLPCSVLVSGLLCFGLTWPVACFLHNTKSITILIKYSKPEDEKERAENEDAEGGGKEEENSIS